MAKTKVLVYTTKQVIEEDTYYSCSNEVYEKIKNAKDDEERFKIWEDFNIWDSEIKGDGNTDNTTTEKIGYGIHND